MRSVDPAAKNRSVREPSRWYAIAAGLVLSFSLHDAIARADPLDEPWRIARADPISRLRSDALSQRRGGAWAIVRARLTRPDGDTAGERSAEDAALLALLAQETDLSARLTAVAALALPAGRDLAVLAPRVEAMRLDETAPPALALAALRALGSVEAQVEAAQARAGVVPDDERAAVALDALAARPDGAAEAHAMTEPLRWRVLARRGDPSVAAAVLGELELAAQQIRGGRGQAAIVAARELRLAEASGPLLAIAQRATERALRREAVAALGELGGVDDGALAALLDDPVTRAPALAAIARLRSVGARPAVQRAAATSDPADRREALAALAALDRRGEAAADAAAEPTGTAASLERVLLTSVDPEARVGAARALARRLGAGAIPAIEAARRVAWSRRMAEGLALARELAVAAAEP